jgi:hypothetical protein
LHYAKVIIIAGKSFRLKIMLLKNEASSPATTAATSVIQGSTYKGLSQQPALIIDSTANQARVVYSFEIPKNAIIREFNQVALYPTNAGDTDGDIQNFLAYYFLVDESGQNFATQSTDSWSASTILLIEWELIISNKNEGTEG